jgi:hypothetical protein
MTSPAWQALERTLERVTGVPIEDLRGWSLEKVREVSGRPLPTGNGLISHEEVEASLDEALRLRKP